MSDTKDDGGPAFPALDGHYRERQFGMSLRQWYAGKVIQGNMANPKYDTSWEVAARHAFEAADAMIEASKK